MDAGDQEEGERPLCPSSGVLWAEKHQPTRKSTPAEREGSLRLVKQRRRRNQGQTPTTLDRYAKVGCRKTKRPSNQVTPKLYTPAKDKSILKLNSAETLIWMQEESNVSNQQEGDQVWSNGEGPSFYRKD